MSGYSEETDCPKCGGNLFHISHDSQPDGNYAFCLECGYGYAMAEFTSSLKDVNEERIEWELVPLTKLRKQRKE